MNYTDYLYFIVPFLILLIWLMFIWWGRTKIICKGFDHLFGKYSSSIDITSKFNTGRIYKKAQFNNRNIYLYGQFTVIGSRFIWYLVLSKESDPSLQTRPALFGKGLALDYMSNTNPKVPIFEKNNLKFDEVMPPNWEFMHALENLDCFFYRLPDFFGLGPTDEIKNWFLCVDRDGDK